MRCLWILLCLWLLGSCVLAQHSVEPIGVMNSHLGQSAELSTKRLRRLGLEVRTLQVVSDREVGLVVGQSPPAGVDLFKSSRIVLRVSQGSSRLEVKPEPVAKVDEEPENAAFFVSGVLQLMAIFFVLGGVHFLRKARREQRT